MEKAEIRELEEEAFQAAAFISAVEEDEIGFHVENDEEHDTFRMYTTNPAHDIVSVIVWSGDSVEKITMPVTELEKARKSFINLVGKAYK